ncbi:unnamed protein product [Brachionus calyciflorus]|uniref:Calpain catalytic domain-containing protein n=1 Tax=Brachionus calyciflorus TaxID=104777 RepID=A0A813M6P9_9BILA|nr:unnamed protein product [Brachionus calyciflorus]
MFYKNFLNQNFSEIKQNCLKSGVLFEDDQFPADKNSISKKNNDEDLFIWKRPHEFITNPVFISEDTQNWYLNQGELGDCWLISGIAALSQNQDKFERIVPKDQNFNENYAGIFRFRFWLYGEWIEVVVDDRLPLKNDKLVYSRNLKNPNEMYGPLLEKAYAKINKGYFNLISGEINDSLTDFTGGLQENFQLKNQKDKDKLWKTILKYFDMKSMAGCAIDLPKNENESLYLENKLRTGHTYTVLKPIEIFYDDNLRKFELRVSRDEDLSKHKNRIRLLKLRNPWGHEIPWTGKWSQDSVEWKKLSNEIKEKIDFVSCQNDGLFFISFDDFLKYFDNLDFVHTNLSIFDNKVHNDDWKCEQFYGEWKIGVNSGGSSNSGNQNFFTNPKYILDLSSESRNVSFIISLMQTDNLTKREKLGKLKGSREALGVHIYKFLENNQVLKDSNIKFVDNTGLYIYKREINRKFELSPGVYLIIPTCFKKDVDMKYFIRFFSDSKDFKISPIELKYQNEEKINNSTGRINKPVQNLKSKNQKIVKKQYISDIEKGKNKTIGMHLTKLDHQDFSEACLVM